MIFIRKGRYAVAARPGQMFLGAAAFLLVGLVLIVQSHHHHASEPMFWGGLFCVLIGAIAAKRALRLAAIAARMTWRE